MGSASYMSRGRPGPPAWLKPPMLADLLTPHDLASAMLPVWLVPYSAGHVPRGQFTVAPCGRENLIRPQCGLVPPVPPDVDVRVVWHGLDQRSTDAGAVVEHLDHRNPGDAYGSADDATRPACLYSSAAKKYRRAR